MGPGDDRWSVLLRLPFHVEDANCIINGMEGGNNTDYHRNSQLMIYYNK